MRKTKLINMDAGFSMTELMVVLVIIGILVLLALPKLQPVVTKAKTTEAKLMLKQVYTLEQSYKFEHDRYSQALPDIGFEQEKLTSEGGQARYKIEVVSANEKSFSAQATSIVDFNGNGTFNVWVVDETGAIKEKVPD
jgi:type IV pilus assembly protein PilE